MSQAAILLVLFLTSFPLVLIVRQSLAGEGFANFALVLERTPFIQFFLNSLFISVLTVGLVLVSALTAAFGLAVLKPRGGRVLQVSIIAGLSVPVVALIVPLFYIIQALGLYNTSWAVILPLVAVITPFGVLVSANYIRSLPFEIYEAAKIDGASDFAYFTRILLPLCAPVIAVVAIFSFLNAWNEYLLALVFLQDPAGQVLTQIPTYLVTDRLIDVPKVFAASVLASAPVILAYLLMQPLFRRGLSAGAVK